MKTRRLLSTILALCLLVSMAPVIRADAQLDTLYEFNGHSYQVFESGMSWSEAKAYCEELGGHLAVITSEEEQLALEAMKDSDRRVWIGGYYQDGQWNWVTGEAWEYEYWGDGEPNGYDDGEECASMWPNEWNDLADGSWEQEGFICEWEYVRESAVCTHSQVERTEEVILEPTCTTSGLVNIQEHCQSCGMELLNVTEETDMAEHAFGLDGICVDCGTNEYDAPEAGAMFNYEGHTYQVFYGAMSWTAAEAYCENVGGYLVVITSEEEQQAIEEMKDGMGTWIGAYRDGEDWVWITGEEWTYSHWRSGEPNNYGGDEDRGAMEESYWNDLSNTNPPEGFICEWDYEKEEATCVHANLQVTEEIVQAASCTETGLLCITEYCPDCQMTNSYEEEIGMVDHAFTDVGICEVCGDTEYETPWAEEVFYFEGHTYQIFTGDLTWTQAKAYCELLGGHLVTITSAEEQAAMMAVKDPAHEVWMGGYLEDEQWRWVTGEAWEYEYWGEGEPNNADGNESYASLWPIFWNDLEDGLDEQNGFVCEWENDDGAPACEHGNVLTVEGILVEAAEGQAGQSYSCEVCQDCGYVLNMQITLFGVPEYIIGDVDENGVVDTDDAVYLLYYILFGEELHPVYQACDFNHDGMEDTDDAIYLLYYTLFGEEAYPLN